MAKQSKTKVLNTFPQKQFGDDGDIVMSRIKGRGVFLCSKVGGFWYAANQMQELNRIGKTSVKDLSTGKLTVSNMVNSRDASDKYLINDGGNIKYRTGKQIVEDLPIPFNNIAYKTAYCSLGQYSDKDTCESNGGTWYYSENDSHDSVSSTAENQLLTVGQSIGTVDAESKLLYNGSTLEIKYDTDFDDNWQTEATADLLKLSYDSDKYATIGIDSDKLTFNLSHDGEFWFTERNAAGSNVARVKINTDTGVLTILNPASILDYFAIDVNANGATEVKTVNGIAGLAANLTLDIAGDIELNADGGQVTIKDGSASHFLFDCDATSLTIYDDTDAADLFSITVAASGVTTIATVDDGAAVGHLTLQPDGDLVLDPASQKTIINATDALYFDGGTHTYIAEITDDKLKIVVGTDRMLTLDEASDAITLAATNWIAGTVSGDTITEFSVANSAYAGMILGYTDIGLDEARVSYSMTTSYAVPTDEFGVTFVAPPSGNVEIMVSFRYNSGSSGLGDIYVGLSDANATSGYNAVEDFHEELIRDGMGRNELTTIQNYWTLTGLTAGTSYTRWLGVKSSNLIGSPTLEYGGSATGHNPDFIMKATALPATIST